MHQVEPFYGWEKYYISQEDERSPFYGVTYNEMYYDRQIYQYLAHPRWDEIGSEGLLVKHLYSNYQKGFAVVELFGVWNDLLQNDFRSLLEACLEPLLAAGIDRLVLIMENVLNIYLDADDYYEALQEETLDGWVCLLRPREHVLREMDDHGISQYFFWSEILDDLTWRKLKPLQLLQAVEQRMRLILN